MYYWSFLHLFSTTSSFSLYWASKTTVCNNVAECGVNSIVKMITKTDLVKLFRMRVKRQRGERGRATGRVCWGAVTVSNRGMWWVSSYLEPMRTVVVWKDVCGNGNAVCVCVCHVQRKSWKRRFFTLDDNAVSYFKSEMVRRTPLPPSICQFFFSPTMCWVLCACLPG